MHTGSFLTQELRKSRSVTSVTASQDHHTPHCILELAHIAGAAMAQKNKATRQRTSPI
jgi:hypothetical protein